MLPDKFTADSPTATQLPAPGTTAQTPPVTEPAPVPVSEYQKRADSLLAALRIGVSVAYVNGVHKVLKDADMIYQYLSNGRWDFPDE
jgi:hypothetical protein